MAGERQITASEVMATMTLAQAIAYTEGYGNPKNAPTRDNNPGDIAYSDFAIKHGATGKDDSTAKRGQPANAIFPNTEVGFQAMDALLSSPTYAGLSVEQVYAKWAQPHTEQEKKDHATNLAKILQLTGLAPTDSNPYAPAIATVEYGVNDAAAVTAINVSGTALTTDQYKTIYDVLNPPLIIETNLYELPWFADRNIVQQKRPVAFPVSFQIFLQPNFQSLLPVTIELKASITSHEKAMQHIVTKQKTRTGLLIDLWGMQLDSITGEGSTGLMQNQFGVTDFISLSSPSSDALAALKHGFTSLAFSNLTSASIPAPSIAQQQAQEAVDAAVRQGLTPVAVVSVAGSVTNAAAIQTESFRVAARDAFAEFLALFKNNGNVWYHSAYNGITTAAQTDPDAWSSTTGLSTFETVSSRNDVMSRGNVVMYFRNAAYYGYFKSLTWTMDAKTPYSWNFSFNFAVESTTLNFTLP